MNMSIYSFGGGLFSCGVAWRGSILPLNLLNGTGTPSINLLGSKLIFHFFMHFDFQARGALKAVLLLTMCVIPSNKWRGVTVFKNMFSHFSSVSSFHFKQLQLRRLSCNITRGLPVKSHRLHLFP